MTNEELKASLIKLRSIVLTIRTKHWKSFSTYELTRLNKALEPLSVRAINSTWAELPVKKAVLK